MNIPEVARHLIGLSRNIPQNWRATYDSEGDVLYLNLKTNPPTQADIRGFDPNPDILIHYDNEENVVGFTVLNASQQTTWLDTFSFQDNA